MHEYVAVGREARCRQANVCARPVQPRELGCPVTVPLGVRRDAADVHAARRIRRLHSQHQRRAVDRSQCRVTADHDVRREIARQECAVLPPLGEVVPVRCDRRRREHNVRARVVVARELGNAVGVAVVVQRRNLYGLIRRRVERLHSQHRRRDIQGGQS